MQEFRSGVSKHLAVDGFSQVLCSFRKSDIEWFIAQPTEVPAGPLLLLCVTTIDYMGGVAYGFSSVDGKNNTSERFKNACRNIMDLTEEETDFLLHAVRHAMVHGGITEGIVHFSSQYNPSERNAITGIDETGSLHLYARSLAQRVLNGITLMDSDHDKWVRDRPGEGSNRVWQNDFETKPGYFSNRLLKYLQNNPHS